MENGYNLALQLKFTKYWNNGIVNSRRAFYSTLFPRLLV